MGNKTSCNIRKSNIGVRTENTKNIENTKDIFKKDSPYVCNICNLKMTAPIKICTTCEYRNKCDSFNPVSKYCDNCKLFSIRTIPEEIHYCGECRYFYVWE